MHVDTRGKNSSPATCYQIHRMTNADHASSHEKAWTAYANRTRWLTDVQSSSVHTARAVIAHRDGSNSHYRLFRSFDVTERQSKSGVLLDVFCDSACAERAITEKLAKPVNGWNLI